MLHFGAAYKLARWLTKTPYDADDVVQESLLRAFAHFGTFSGADPKAWLLAIVRNTFYSWLRKNKVREVTTAFREDLHTGSYKTTTPEDLHIQHTLSEELRDCIEALPVEFREVIVLREVRELSYRQIADITGLPIGTVMSRLSRGRRRVQARVINSQGRSASPHNAGAAQSAWPA